MSHFETIYTDTNMSHRAKIVYMYLKNQMDSERRCWLGIQQIAADLRLSRSTVKRALGELEAGGYLQRIQQKSENGGCTHNLYIVI